MTAVVALLRAINVGGRHRISMAALRAHAGETIVRTGEALWIHFPNGVGASKLAPAGLDRAVGSPVTMRNLRTVAAITELVTAD